MRRTRAKFDFPPINVEQGYEVVAKLRELGEKYEASVAQMALAWLMAKPYVSSVIIGATNLQQLEDNLAAAKVTLSAEDIQTLDGLTAPAVPYPTWMQPMGFDEKVKDALGT